MHRGGGQIVPAARRCSCYAAVLTCVSPRLWKPYSSSRFKLLRLCYGGIYS
eukprot:GABW01001225.1.p1 GENE.GABW01001225.1~~GABW01001225.1.p1  ORF type:complete len:51 (-),score=4.01 GABW01001225.1:53-205(-)